MAQRRETRRRAARRLILRFDGGDDAAVWAWLDGQPDREAAAKAALFAAAASAQTAAAAAPPAAQAAVLADQVAKLINILDRVTLAGGAPRPIGMSLGPAEPIRPFQVVPAPSPTPGALEAAAADDRTTLDRQVDQKIAKLLRFGDDLFAADAT